jgi:hypothetical protein
MCISSPKITRFQIAILLSLPNFNIITTSKFQYHYHFQISVLLPLPNFNNITTAKFQYYYHFQISILLPLPKFQYYYHFKISILLPLQNFNIITTSKNGRVFSSAENKQVRENKQRIIILEQSLRRHSEMHVTKSAVCLSP